MNINKPEKVSRPRTMFYAYFDTIEESQKISVGDNPHSALRTIQFAMLNARDKGKELRVLVGCNVLWKDRGCYHQGYPDRMSFINPFWLEYLELKCLKEVGYAA